MNIPTISSIIQYFWWNLLQSPGWVCNLVSIAINTPYEYIMTIIINISSSISISYWFSLYMCNNWFALFQTCRHTIIVSLNDFSLLSKTLRTTNQICSVCTNVIPFNSLACLLAFHFWFEAIKHLYSHA